MSQRQQLQWGPDVADIDILPEAKHEISYSQLSLWQ